MLARLVGAMGDLERHQQVSVVNQSFDGRTGLYVREPEARQKFRQRRERRMKRRIAGKHADDEVEIRHKADEGGGPACRVPERDLRSAAALVTFPRTGPRAGFSAAGRSSPGGTKRKRSRSRAAARRRLVRARRRPKSANVSFRLRSDGASKMSRPTTVSREVSSSSEDRI